MAPIPTTTFFCIAGYLTVYTILFIFLFVSLLFTLFSLSLCLLVSPILNSSFPFSGAKLGLFIKFKIVCLGLNRSSHDCLA